MELWGDGLWLGDVIGCVWLEKGAVLIAIVVKYLLLLVGVVAGIIIIVIIVVVGIAGKGIEVI